MSSFLNKTKGFISDLLPLLKDTIESAMTDPSTAMNNANTYEVKGLLFYFRKEINWSKQIIYICVYVYL